MIAKLETVSFVYKPNLLFFVNIQIDYIINSCFNYVICY